MGNLFSYPNQPGHKAHETSAAAAADMAVRAPTLRSRVLELLRRADMTADECATALGASILSVRPRLSELEAKGLILETAVRRPNASGKMAIVWRAA